MRVPRSCPVHDVAVSLSVCRCSRHIHGGAADNQAQDVMALAAGGSVVEAAAGLRCRITLGNVPLLELYHHGTSACAAKVRLALAEKQLAWQGHVVDILAGQQFDPGFLRINPKAVVPVLVHDGVVIRESTVICEYLEEVFPEYPVYPRDAYERA